MSRLEIVAVTSRADLRRFVAFPHRLYDANRYPNWVAPLRMAVRDALDERSIRLRASSGRHYYPDVLVACGDEPENETAYTEDAPCLIVEVLSPSTTATDRREKRIAYCALPTVRHYLVVDAEKNVIEHHRRIDEETYDLFVHRPGDTIELSCPPGARLDVGWLLA